MSAIVVARGARRAVLVGLGLALASASGPAARAHSLGTSSLQVRIDGAGAISARWRMAVGDLDATLGLDGNRDRRIDDRELEERAADIARFALARLEVMADGRLCPLRSEGQEIEATALALRLVPSCPARVDRLSLRYDLFVDRDSGHRGLLAVEHGGRTHSAVFTAADRVRTFALGTHRWWQPLVEYPRQGVWHIWIGFDHILFLLTLLLPAVLVRRRGPPASWEPVAELRPALLGVVRIVTAFTVAHSLTLSLAALGIVAPPPRVVESAIAASVVVAAANNLWPFLTRRLWLVAFGFGLVHGFGFAHVLQELGLPRGQAALALLGFNLGVEFGQLALVALFLPLAFGLRRARAYLRFGLQAGSALAGALASVWLLERALDLRDAAAPPAPAVQPSEASTRAEGYAREGDLHVAAVDLPRAQARYRQALAVREQLADRAGQAVQHRNLAVVALLAGDTAQAASQHRRALELHEALSMEAAAAQDLTQLGLVYQKTGQLAEAETALTRALALDAKLGQRDRVADHHTRLGNVHLLRQQLDRAEDSYQQALALTPAHRQLETANVYANLGNVYRLRGDRERALRMYRQSLPLFQATGAEGKALRVQRLLAQLEAPP